VKTNIRRAEYRKQDGPRLQAQQYRKKKLVHRRNYTQTWRDTHPVETRKQDQRSNRRRWDLGGVVPIGPFDPVEIRRKQLEQVLKEARERG
jgi:hypothetical protein